MPSIAPPESETLETKDSQSALQSKPTQCFGGEEGSWSVFVQFGIGFLLRGATGDGGGQTAWGLTQGSMHLAR